MHRGFKLQPFAFGQNRDAMIAEHPAHQNRVARPRLCRRKGYALAHQADAGGIDEDAVGASLLHNLGVTSHNFHTCVCGSLVHGTDDAAQRFDRQTFFQNECGAQPQRFGAAHGQVVDGAMHGQRADVASAKNQGFHDKGIRGDG